jgi:hypothetical protein
VGCTTRAARDDARSVLILEQPEADGVLARGETEDFRSSLCKRGKS